MSHVYERDNYTQTALASSASIPGEILLYGFTVYNSSGAEVFVQLFDDGYAVPADGTVPVSVFPVASEQEVSVYYGEAGRLCRGGVTLVNSSTDTAKTVGSDDCLFDVQYARRVEV